jgi:hypothetical protein
VIGGWIDAEVYSSGRRCESIEDVWLGKSNSEERKRDVSYTARYLDVKRSTKD